MDRASELLIARVHVCGNIVCLGQRNNPSLFFGIKGHIVFLPQDTTRLIDLLPMSPASLSDIVKVVWTGRSKPDKSRLRSRFMVRKNKVYNALKWLFNNHEDYRNNVTIDEERINGWESTFVTVELLDSIGHVWIFQQKMPLEMDLVWTIPTMTKPQTIFRLRPQELLTLIILQKFPMQLF